MSNVVQLSDHLKLTPQPVPFQPYRRWKEAMAHRDLAEAACLVAWWDFRNAESDFGKESSEWWAAKAAYGDTLVLPRVIATSRAMMTPAPDIKTLKWKLRARKHDGGHPKWENAIMADRERLDYWN